MKKIVLFTAAFQTYSKGDVAGFDVDVADDLINKKNVAEEYEAPEIDPETLTIKMDGAEAEAKIAAMVKEAEADLQAKAKARSDALDAREAALNEREKSIVKDEAELDKYAGELKALKADLEAREAALAEPTKETTSAKPPKQGGK